MEAGQSPAHFWALTLRELQAVLDGAAAALRRQHNERAWLAWHTARLTAYAPQKARDFQKIETLMHGARPAPRRRQTPEEQIAIAHRWTAALRGR